MYLSSKFYYYAYNCVWSSKIKIEDNHGKRDTYIQKFEIRLFVHFSTLVLYLFINEMVVIINDL